MKTRTKPMKTLRFLSVCTVYYAARTAVEPRLNPGCTVVGPRLDPGWTPVASWFDPGRTPARPWLDPGRTPVGPRQDPRPEGVRYPPGLWPHAEGHWHNFFAIFRGRWKTYEKHMKTHGNTRKPMGTYEAPRRTNECVHCVLCGAKRRGENLSGFTVY